MLRFIALGMLVLSSGCFLDSFASEEAGGPSTGGSSDGGSSTGGTSPDGGAAPTGGGGAVSDGGGGASGCAATEDCAPPAPTGDIVVVASGEQPCPPGYADAVIVGDGTDPGCSACSCSMPTAGETCTGGTESGYFQPDCDEFAGASTLTPDSCFPIPFDPGSIDSYRLNASTPSEGTCVGTASTPVAPSVRTICTLTAEPAGECGSNGACVPAPTAPFDRVCNWLPDADSECAEGWTEEGITAALEADTRACGCECTEMSDPTCQGASLRLYNGNSCQGAAVATFAADGQCHDAENLNAHDSQIVTTGTWTPGTCGASAEVSDGAITWGEARKLCCLP